MLHALVVPLLSSHADKLQQIHAFRKRWCAGSVADKDLLFEKPSPITLAKAIKNKAELAGMHEAHLRDSVALAQTLHWLEQEVSHTSLLCSGLIIKMLPAEQYMALSWG